MKTLLLIITLLSTGHLFASPIYEQRFQACQSWSFVYGPNGGGYVCSFYPNTVSVPETHSIVSNFNELASQIDVLESRIQDLERKLAEKK